ncbi:MAG TPA: lytic transglycosylase domain-containing protein [Spirochaetota bacterium]|nr:lytic transglycosylase domain-containing protein [Spirochaetota bacterium]
MMEDMYAVMQRINEIRSRFKSMRHNQNQHPAQQRETQAQGFDEQVSRRMRENESTVAEPRGVQQINRTDARHMSIEEIQTMAREYANANRVPAGLVNAIIETESSYNPSAVSPRGAMGLMQLMPATARQLGVENPFMPEENVRGGVQLIRQLLDRYNGDYRKALAAYNAGEGAVDRHNGVPPYSETQNYVNRVIDSYQRNR